MAASLRQQVQERAGGRCEYCQLPQEFTVTPHELDHIRAQKHSGATTPENLAWSCFYCNSFKGSDVAGYDDETNTLQPLFNPRVDSWSEHFGWDGPQLKGKTPIGRATIAVLRINLPERVEHRRRLMEAGVLPAPGPESDHG
jgi:5-methylcytosine-specific restriction endonuclease McrA